MAKSKRFFNEDSLTTTEIIAALSHAAADAEVTVSGKGMADNDGALTEINVSPDGKSVSLWVECFY